MKKFFMSLAIVSMLVACGGGSAEKKEEGEKKEVATDNSENPVYKKGLDLVSKNDCLTCHNIREPHTGPSYQDVANKYASYPDTIVAHLANKVISGGTGVWGETFMTPHAGVTKEDAEAMVKYILLLKNK
ncbi:MAG TPA: c-type cytochrome [Chitinophagaceae bacterium]